MKVFLCEPIHQQAYALLNQHLEIIDDINKINECEIIITRNIKVDQKLIDNCLQLQLIAVHGSGYDDVDIEYAKEKGIHLMNTPGENALSVSELIITFMLELSRQTRRLQKDFFNHKVQEIAPIAYMGNEISYKTFGMIGVGQIALQTANILKNGFHMKVIGYSRSLTPKKAKELGIGYCETLQDVLSQSDFVSLGTSLNDETYHLISSKELSYMKPHSYLINTSRGAVIDEKALYNALVTHQIAGAGLDVLENEPVLSTHPLLQLDNVIYMPHMGASTDDALLRVGMCLVHNIIDFSIKGYCEKMIF